jgi:6-phosphofructokinase 1
MVDFLEREKIDILFCVGGDGTLRGAHEICEEVARRKARIGVVGIPKTIDNDIHYVWRSFGYVTALEKSREVLEGAHIEAKGSPNGIGLVRLMGRNAGFIAAGATIASQHVNFTLVPEVPFELEGKNGFLEHLRRRILARHHALVVVAEGAGQHLFNEADHGLDPSGNRRHGDIGLRLKEEIVRYFGEREIPVAMKYIDPSYHIRSTPASVGDALLCDQLARNAAHAAMAGKTDLIIGLWNNHCVHVPIALATAEKRYMSERGEIWNAVLAATGQPARFG